MRNRNHRKGQQQDPGDDRPNHKRRSNNNHNNQRRRRRQQRKGQQGGEHPNPNEDYNNGGGGDQRRQDNHNNGGNNKNGKNRRRNRNNNKNRSGKKTGGKNAKKGRNNHNGGNNHNKNESKNKNLYKTKQIFVGGCHPEIQKIDLKTYFEQFGKVVESRLVKDKRSKKFRGFAFVSFSSFNAVDRVMKHKGPHTIIGKEVDINEAFTKEQTRNKLLEEKSRKLYITGIPKELGEAEIEAYFKRFGVIVSTRVIHDPSKKKEKGYGFVLFQTQGGLKNSVSIGEYHTISGVILECKQTLLREEMNSGAEKSKIGEQDAALEGLGGPGGGLGAELNNGGLGGDPQGRLAKDAIGDELGPVGGVDLSKFAKKQQAHQAEKSNKKEKRDQKEQQEEKLEPQKDEPDLEKVEEDQSHRAEIEEMEENSSQIPITPSKKHQKEPEVEDQHNLKIPLYQPFPQNKSNEAVEGFDSRPGQISPPDGPPSLIPLNPKINPRKRSSSATNSKLSYPNHQRRSERTGGDDSKSYSGVNGSKSVTNQKMSGSSEHRESNEKKKRRGNSSDHNKRPNQSNNKSCFSITNIKCGAEMPMKFTKFYQYKDGGASFDPYSLSSGTGEPQSQNQPSANFGPGRALDQRYLPPTTASAGGFEPSLGGQYYQEGAYRQIEARADMMLKNRDGVYGRVSRSQAGWETQIQSYPLMKNAGTTYATCFFPQPANMGNSLTPARMERMDPHSQGEMDHHSRVDSMHAYSQPPHPAPVSEGSGGHLGHHQPHPYYSPNPINRHQQRGIGYMGHSTRSVHPNMVNQGTQYAQSTAGYYPPNRFHRTQPVGVTCNSQAQKYDPGVYEGQGTSPYGLYPGYNQPMGYGVPAQPASPGYPPRPPSSQNGQSVGLDDATQAQHQVQQQPYIRDTGMKNKEGMSIRSYVGVMEYPTLQYAHLFDDIIPESDMEEEPAPVCSGLQSNGIYSRTSEGELSEPNQRFKEVETASGVYGGGSESVGSLRAELPEQIQEPLSASSLKGRSAKMMSPYKQQNLEKEDMKNCWKKCPKVKKGMFSLLDPHNDIFNGCDENESNSVAPGIGGVGEVCELAFSERYQKTEASMTGGVGSTHGVASSDDEECD